MAGNRRRCASQLHQHKMIADATTITRFERDNLSPGILYANCRKCMGSSYLSEDSNTPSSLPKLIDSETDCPLEGFSEELLQLLEEQSPSSDYQILSPKAEISSSSQSLSSSGCLNERSEPHFLLCNLHTAESNLIKNGRIILPEAITVRRIVKRATSAPAEAAPGRGKHILRERKRRDDMSKKFAMLETLLPWRSKRDRTAIVDDATHFISEMQKRLKHLEIEAQEKTSRAAEVTAKYNMTGCNDRQNAVSRIECAAAQDGKLKVASFGVSSCWQRQNEGPEFAQPSFVPSSLETHIKDLGGMLEVNVFIKRSEEVYIEIGCRSSPRVLTRVLRAMEELELDVVDCNFCKMKPESLCIIFAKMRRADAVHKEEIETTLRCALFSTI